MTELHQALGREDCDSPSEYRTRTANALQGLIPSDRLNDMAALFRVLGDPMRLQILNLLNQRELCVCDLSELLNAGQSAVSNHLRVLRAHRLVRTRKEGKLVFYMLDAPHIKPILSSQMKEAVNV